MRTGKIILTSAMIAASLSVSPARADPPVSFTGNDLYRHCKNNSTSCSDFLVTMDQAVGVMTELGMVKKTLCPTAGSTLGQDRLIFQRFAEQNPKMLSYPAVAVYLASQIDAYPCSQK